VALACASLVAISTLLTKQHYVVDLIAGIVLALAAYAIFLRGYPRAKVPELDRRLAPVLALCVGGMVSVGVGCMWLAYRLTVGN
jgi:membrane-associated phospholipid phosphatase